MALCEFCEGVAHAGGCDREQLKRVIGTLRETVRIRSAELQATRKLDGPNVVMISSLVSGRTGKPRVDIQIGELHTQLPVDAAIDIARNLFQVCAGAHADGFIVHFLTEKLDQPKEVAGRILEEFRVYREELAEEFKKDQEE